MGADATDTRTPALIRQIILETILTTLMIQFMATIRANTIDLMILITMMMAIITKEVFKWPLLGLLERQVLVLYP